MADKFMKFIETMDMSYSYKPVLLKAIYEYMDTSGRVALPDVVDYCSWSFRGGSKKNSSESTLLRTE